MTRDDSEGAIAAVAKYMCEHVMGRTYKEPFYLDVEDTDPSRSLLRRIEQVDVRPVSEAAADEQRRFWIRRVADVGDEGFEMEGSYLSYISMYRATRRDGRWHAESFGLGIVVD